MSERYPGGFITKDTPVLNPALGAAAPGIWTLDQVMQARKAGTWPPYDPYYPYVTLNLHGNGTNGAQNNTFLDSSANSFNFTRNGSVTQGTFTPYGANWSNYFGGSGNYLTVGAASNWQFLNSGASDYTIEAWIFFSSVSAQQFICATNAAGAAVGVNFQITSSATLTLEFTRGVGGSFATFTSTGTVTANAWNHVAVTFATSGKTASFYINGAAAGSSSNTGYSYSASNPSNTLNIAREPSGSGSVTGYISNLRITNTIVYSSAFTPNTSPLTAVSGTSLLTCQSNRFIDNSASPLTITVTGSPSVQRFSPFSPSASYSTSVVGGSAYLASGTYITSTNGGSVASNQDFTCEGWIYFTQAIDNTSICTTAADLGVIFTTSGQTLNSYDGSFRSWGKTIPLNRWCYLVIMRSGSTAYTWIDGVYNNSFTFSAGWNWNGSGRSSFAIFGNADGANKGIGYQANWRFSTIARYNTSGSNITVPTSPLTTDANTTWLLDGTNGGIIDNAMMTDLETVGSAQISTSTVKYGTGSIFFNGSGSWLQVPPTPNLEFGSGDFTIEMWINPSVTSRMAIYHGSDNADWSIGIDYNAQKFNIWASSNGTSWNLINADPGGNGIGGITIATGTWTHVAYVRSGTTWQTYVNGVRDINLTGISGTIVNRAAYAKSVGKWFFSSGSGAPGVWNGYMDEVRFTKGYARYTANFTPQTSQWQDQ